MMMVVVVIQFCCAVAGQVDASGEIMLLSSTGCPWKDHLLELEEELQSNGPLVKYVLFVDSTSSWRVQCVPTSKNSFENRSEVHNYECFTL